MIERMQPGPRMSQAVIHGDTVYIAGQVAGDPSANLAGQTRQVLWNRSIDCWQRLAATRRAFFRRPFTLPTSPRSPR